MKNVLKVSKLGKKYRFSQNGDQPKYHSVREELASSFRRLFKKISSPDKNKNKDFWALREASFTVREGERVGIIGRNGAGKSTLLKLIGRITKPTEGEIYIDGRVATLLEVGTGFHPELTGRDNIYLSGAILGMKKREIAQKFDEIVAFSGVEKFLDLPVKRYSSGMHVRLGFAVAAHLEPEILLVDEVLAVGDAEFQKKCIRKISKEASSGKTVLFVSHQMQAIENLCEKVIYLEDGKVKMVGETKKVISAYLQNTTETSLVLALADRKDRVGRGLLRWSRTWLEDGLGKRIQIVRTGDDFVIAGEFNVLKQSLSSNVQVAFALYNSREEILSDISHLSLNQEMKITMGEGGNYVIRCKIKRCPLVGGIYRYNMMLRSNMDVEDFIISAAQIEVENGDFFGSGKLIPSGLGSFVFEQIWQLDQTF